MALETNSQIKVCGGGRPAMAQAGARRPNLSRAQPFRPRASPTAADIHDAVASTSEDWSLEHESPESHADRPSSEDERRAASQKREEREERDESWRRIESRHRSTRFRRPRPPPTCDVAPW